MNVCLLKRTYLHGARLCGGNNSTIFVIFYIQETEYLLDHQWIFNDWNNWSWLSVDRSFQPVSSVSTLELPVILNLSGARNYCVLRLFTHKKTDISRLNVFLQRMVPVGHIKPPIPKKPEFLYSVSTNSSTLPSFKMTCLDHNTSQIEVI